MLGDSSLVLEQAFKSMRKGRASLPAPNLQANRQILDLENRHNLERVRIDDQDLLPDDDELKSSPFRIDRDHSLRQHVDAHVARNAGADRDREIDVGDRRNMLVPDHGCDLGALLGRELCRSAGLSGRLRLDRRSRLGLCLTRLLTRLLTWLRLGGRLTRLLTFLLTLLRLGGLPSLRGLLGLGLPGRLRLALALLLGV